MTEKASKQRKQQSSIHKLQSTMRDCSALPTELLGIVVTKLAANNFVDIIRFQAVCKLWQSTSSSIQHIIKRNPAPNVPWLMLSDDKDINSTTTTTTTTTTRHCGFFSVSDKRVYWLELPMARDQRFCGSTHGWLIMMDDNLGVSLLNPITKAEIHIQNLFSQAVVKVVCSSTPTLKGCVVMVIYGDLHRLATCKPGGISWTVLNSMQHCYYDDVEYFEGNFYAVDNYGSVMIFDGGFLESAIEIKPRESIKSHKNYLVESSGELLLVTRYRPCIHDWYQSVLFKVFRKNRENGNWVQLESLGDHALFLGANHSFSLVATNFWGIKRNCIYFINNTSKECTSVKPEHDVGIFNLADCSVEPLPDYSYDQPFISHQPLMWVATSPW